MISVIELAYSFAVSLIHSGSLDQRAGSLLGMVQTWFLGGSFCSTWLGFLTGICQVLSPECDIIICDPLSRSPWHLWLWTTGRVAVLLSLPFVGGIHSVQGMINLIPRRVVWDSLGFTPPQHATQRDHSVWRQLAKLRMCRRTLTCTCKV